MKRTFMIIFLSVMVSFPLILSAEDKPENLQEETPALGSESMPDDQDRQPPERQQKDDSGFYGSLILGAIWKTGTPSQLDVTDDNRIADDLTSNAGNASEFKPLPMPELGYVFKSTGTEISFGGSRAYGAFGLTVSQPFKKIGTLSITGSYGQDDVWKDPYITDVKRKKTDSISIGGELKWERIFNTGLMVSYGYDNVEVDKDEIGDRYESLRRDGDIHNARIGYVIPFSRRNILIPSVSASRDELKGDSNSNNRVGVGIEHIYTWKKINFATSMSAGFREFDEIHPVYGKTRDESDFSVNEFITFIEPFGFKQFSTHILLGFSYADSNIDFFDSSIMMMGLGVGYSF